MYKVMIVDDEEIIRQGISCLIDWDKYGCEVVFEASNGMEALQYLNSSPEGADILVTDIRMPGMDGLKLTESICESFNNIKIILLTAFADFSYAQKAIGYNVAGYVLKTNFTDSLPPALEHAISQIAEERAKINELNAIKESMNEKNLLAREKVLIDIFNGIITSKDEIESFSNRFGIISGNFYVAVFELNAKNILYDEAELEEQDKYAVSIKKILESSFKNFDHIMVLISKNHFACFVKYNNDKKDIIPEFSELFRNIITTVENLINASVCIGISGLHSNLQEIRSAYIEATDSLTSIFNYNEKISFYNSKRSTAQSKSSISINKYIDDIISLIISNKLSDIKKPISELFEQYANNAMPIVKAKMAATLTFSSVLNTIDDLYLNNPNNDQIEINFYLSIQNSKSLKNIYDALCKYIELICHNITTAQVPYNIMVRQINQYIRQNYNKPINLQLIADYFHINSSYLSRLYKKETGISLIDAINMYRIEIAKKLLKDPSKKIFEIACAVGIEEPAYFTHVFTKYAAMSPKEYKNKLNSI